MLTQNYISDTVREAKYHTSTLLKRITDKLVYGDKNPIEKKQFNVLIKYIEILEDFLVDNFDSDGNITPVSDCLDADDINNVCAKVKLLIGNCRYPKPQWFLGADMIFNDQGYIFEDSNNYIRDNVYWS